MRSISMSRLRTALVATVVGAVCGVLAGALSGPLAATATVEQPAESTCDDLTVTVTPAPATVRAWRAVVDDQVVWRSGDWADENLGDDHQALVDAGWTLGPDATFEVSVAAAAATGPVTLQWWHTNPAGSPNGWTDWPGGSWSWENPGDCPTPSPTASPQPTATATPTTPSTSPTEEPGQGSGGELAQTGSPLATMALAGVGLLGAGGAAVLTAWRRRARA